MTTIKILHVVSAGSKHAFVGILSVKEFCLMYYKTYCAYFFQCIEVFVPSNNPFLISFCCLSCSFYFTLLFSILHYVETPGLHPSTVFCFYFFSFNFLIPIMHHSTFFFLDFCPLPLYSFTPLPFSCLVCSFFVHSFKLHSFILSIFVISPFLVTHSLFPFVHPVLPLSVRPSTSFLPFVLIMLFLLCTRCLP